MAAILALGIYLISRLEEARRDDFLFGPPPLRILTEESPDASVRCELTATVLSVRISGENASVTVRAGKEAGKLLVSLKNDGELPVPGSRILLSGKTELFDPALNPGGFSYRDYYDSIGIWLRFRADSVSVLSEGSRIGGWIYRFRNRLAESIGNHADPEDAGILKSMLLSDKSELDREERDAFSFLGILQMITLSGLQLMFLGNLVFGSVRKKTGKPVPAFLAGFSAVLILSVFTGFSMSSVRAMVIYCMRAGAVFLKRHFDLASAGALALILLMLEMPLCIFTSGFHYMAGIIIAAGILNDLVLRFLRIRGGIYRGLFTALSVQMLMLPLRLFHSFSWSILSPFLYACLFPVSGIIFVLGALGSAAGLISGGAAGFLLGAEHWFIKFMRLLAEAGRRARGFTVITGRPGGVRLCVYFLICILVIACIRILLNRRKEVPEDRELRITAGLRIGTAAVFLSVIVFGLIFLHAETLPKDTAEILMMDCGQGDAFLIRTGSGTVILSDAGSSSDDTFYRDQLSKTLLYYGIREIDYIIVSHPDADHTSGIADLLADGFFDAGYLIYAKAQEEDPALEALLRLTDRAGTVRLPASAGKELQLSGGKLRFLWPDVRCTESGNEASLVYLFEYQDHLALFTGDISSEEEKKLTLPDIDLLKVPHHGSKYSSSAAFLTAASPETALISCGRNNSYGHPAPETLKRLQDAGADIYTTQHKGAVSVLFSDDRILVKPLSAWYD